MMSEKRTIVIYYWHQLGGSFNERKWWCAYFKDNNEVWDYHTKETLIHNALSTGYRVEVQKNNRKTGKFETIKIYE